MDRHDQIRAFSLAAHRLAVERLRERPERLEEALGVLRRWRQQAGGPAHCGPYWDEWERLLMRGIDAVEGVACAPTDHAATLRSVSPLGRFITPAERNHLLKQARETA
jgi:hypothetical protein